MAKTRGIQWADIANTNVGRMNAHKVADVWPTKATNAAKKSKYGNVKTIIDGIKFDSKGEGLLPVWSKSEKPSRTFKLWHTWQGQRY